MLEPQLRYPGGETGAPVLVWQFERRCRSLGSAPFGGGLGLRSWIVNAQVAKNYARTDLDAHLGELAGQLGVSGPGVGLLTAASVTDYTSALVDGVRVDSTVGISGPAWAAPRAGAWVARRAETAWAAPPAEGTSAEPAAEHASHPKTGVGTVNVVAQVPVSEQVPSTTKRPSVGTVNIVARVPVRLSDAALVNAVITVTEAKSQAFADSGVDGTGTATDAVCVVCLPDGDPEPFAGPRSYWGERLAAATHRTVVAGIRRWQQDATS